MDIWSYDREKINENYLNNLNNNYFINGDARSLRSKNISPIKYMSNGNNKNNIGPIDNIDFKLNYEKWKKKRYYIK